MSNGDIVKGIRSSIEDMIKVFMKWVFIVLIIIYFLTGFYSIKQNEIGVLQRFGRLIDGKVMPGMHYALPWPIDKVDKVAVMEIKTLVMDNFSKDFSPDSPAGRFLESTSLSVYCITGDNNIITINLLIKYKITDPVLYLFKIKNSRQFLRNAAAATVIHCLASLPVDEVLTYGKKRIQDEVKLELQNKLDDIESGLGISFIELKEISPPQSVQSYFDDVINAKVDKKKIVNDARSYQNQMLPRARANSVKMVQEAYAYKKGNIFYAEGEASRFLSQLAEYEKSKQVSTTRLYLNFICSVYPRLDDIIIVDNKENEKLLNIKVFSK